MPFSLYSLELGEQERTIDTKPKRNILHLFLYHAKRDINSPWLKKHIMKY